MTATDGVGGHITPLGTDEKTYMSLQHVTKHIHIYVYAALLLSVTVLLVFALDASKAEGAFNEQINYQGKLTDSTGALVSDGDYDMEFKLYTVDSGGTAIWTETLTGANQVTVTNGLFSVMLGSSTSLSSIDFDQTLYLGVNIESDGEMTPRKVLGAVPAAFEADQIDGLDSTQFLRSDTSDTLASSSASTLLTINQSGAGDILNLLDDSTEVFTVLDGGNVGIGTSTPSHTLSVEGSSTLGDSATAGFFTATTTATSSIPTLSVTGLFYDTNGTGGADGEILQTTGSGVDWVATSSLGLGSVTSVAASVPTGWSISGSPITSAGTLAFDYDTGYAAVLTASTSNWNDFYDTPSDRITAGDGIEWSTNTLNVNDVTAAMLSSSDFGDFTCNGTTCSFDDDTIGTAEIADADFGAFTFSGGSATLDDDTVSSSTLNIANWTDGYVLQASTTAGGGFDWVATTTLGFTDTTLTQEEVEDFAGAMVSGNTETLITVTYEDGDGTIDFVVDNDLSNYDNSSSNFFDTAGTNLNSSGSTINLDDTISLTGASTTEATSTLFYTPALKLGTEILTSFSGNGIVFNSGTLDFDCSDVTDTSNDGLTCSSEDLVVSADANNFIDDDWGDLSVSSNSVTLDNDVVGTDEIADADFGAFTFSGGSATLDDDTVSSSTLNIANWTDGYVLQASTTAGGGFDWVATTTLGFTDTTLTQEEVEDFAGAMVSGNTETLITVTYEDGDGTIDFVVDNDLSNYDNSSSNFFDTAGTNLNSSGSTINLDDTISLTGASTTEATSTLFYTPALKLGTEILTSFSGNGIVFNSGTLDFDCSDVTDTSNDGLTCSSEDLVVSADANNFIDDDWGDLSVSSNSVTLDNDVVGTDEIADADFGAFTFSGGSATLDDDTVSSSTLNIANWTDGYVLQASTTAGGGFDWVATTTLGFTDTTLTQEEVEDFAGAMVSGNTETLITVTYEDGDGTIDFVVDNDLSNYDNSSSNFFDTAGTNLNSSGSTINLDDTISLTGASTTEATSTLFYTPALKLGTEILTSFSGNGIVFNSGTLDFDCSDVTDTSNDGLTCSSEDLVVSADANNFIDDDWGDLSVSSNSVTLDNDVVGTDEIADADFGAFTFSGGSATLDDDTVSSSTLNIANWTDGYVLQASTTAGGGFDWVATTTLGFVSSEVNNLETIATDIADTEIFIGTGADAGNYVSISGDATLANNGVLTLAEDAVSSSTLDIANWTDGYILQASTTASSGFDWIATSTLNIALLDTTGTLGETRGGTGITSYSTGDILYADGSNSLVTLSAGSNGNVLKLAGGVPTWGSDNTGGGGGSGLWATTTNDQIVYPADTSDIVVVGANATSSTNTIFEVQNGNAYFEDFVGIGTSTPSHTLSVEGSSTLGDSATAGFFTATTTATSSIPTLSVTGLFYDTNGTGGADGEILQTTGSGVDWVATSSLGLGSVTSVAASVPTGWSISGSPITSAGTLAFDYDTGYAAVLTASTSNWNDFYDTPSDRITAGDGIEWSTNTLNVNDVTAAMLSSSDFGDFTCNGTTCSFDDDTIGTAEIADADFGAFTFSGGSATLDDDTVSSSTLNIANWTDGYVLQASTTAGGGFDWVATTTLGFTDTTLTQEEVEDFAGAMVSGNTETLITVTYEDGDGTIDFVVDNDLSNYDNSSSNFFDTAGTNLNSSGSTINLDDTISLTGASTTEATSTLFYTPALKLGTEILTSFSGNGIVFNSGTLDFDCSDVTDTSNDGLTCSSEDLVVSADANNFIDDDWGDLSVSSNSVTLDNDVVGTDEIADADFGAFTFSGGSATLDDDTVSSSTLNIANWTDGYVLQASTTAGGGFDWVATTTLGFTDTTLTQEEVEDFAGAMVSGNTETLITVTYEDGDGTIDFVVDNDLSNYDNSSSNFFDTAGTNLNSSGSTINLDDTISLTGASTTEATSTLFYTPALKLGTEILTSFSGNGIVFNSGTLDFDCSDVTDTSNDGLTCSSEDLVVSADANNFIDDDWGDLSVSSNSVTLDNDVVGTDEIADADFGAFTFSGGSATLDDDTVSSSTLNIANWTDGYVLQASTTAGGGFDWVATTTLGFTDTTLTQEEVEDFAGAMVSGNTETLITVTYEDGDGTIDFVVDNDLSNYDNSSSNFFDTAGTNLNSSGSTINLDDTISLTGASTTEATSTLFYTPALKLGTEILTSFSGNGIVFNSGTLDFDCSDVTDTSNDGLTCSSEDLVVSADANNFIDDDWGDLSVSSNSVTLDNDVVGTDEIADADFGAFTFSGGSATLDDDTVSSSTLNIANWTDGYVLQASTTAGGGFDWVATTTLGFGDNTFLGLTDTPSSFTTSAIPYESSGALAFSSTFVFTGTNLGIGDATPAAALTVGNGDDFQVSSTGLVSVPDGSEVAPAISFVSDDDLGFYRVEEDTLGFVANTAEVLRIESDGDIIFNQDTNTTIGRPTTDQLALTTGGTEGLRLDESQRLGITDTDPDYRLEVLSSSGSGYFGVTNSSDGDIFVINGSGNVGIGSTTPGYRLSVEGNSSLGINARAGSFTATTTATSSIPTLSVTGLFYDTNGTGGADGQVLSATGSGVEWIATSTWDTTLTEDEVEAFIFDADNSGTLESGTLALDSLSFTGTLNHEYGGLEADVSAYSGLIGINSGSTSEVDTESELETHLGSLDVVTVTTDDITSANLATLLSNETGSGNAVFSASPTFTGTAVFATASTSDLIVSDTATTTNLTITALTNALLSTNALGQVVATSSLSSSVIEDVYVLNTGDSISGNLTFSGSAANIALGSNFLSGDGDDEGVFVDSDGNVGIGIASFVDELEVASTSDTVIKVFTVSSDAGAIASLEFVTESAANRPKSAIIAEKINGSDSRNSLIFAVDTSSGTGHVNTDDAKLVIEGTTGFVGIGSTTPWKTLSVEGDLSLTGALFDGADTAGTDGQILQTTGSITQWVATSSLGIDTTLTQEEVEDFAGAMVSGNTETLITVTYEDGDGTIDFVVDNDLSNYDNSSSNFFDTAGTNLNSSGSTINLDDTISLTGASTTEATSTLFYTPALKLGTEILTSFSGNGIVFNSGTLDFDCSDVTDTSNDGLTCSSEDLVVSADANNFIDDDWGDLSVSSNSVTLDNDVVGTDEIADADFGAFTFSGGSATLDDDTVSSSTLNIANWTDGYVLQASTTAGGGFDWVATTTLGFGDNTFLGLTDTGSSFTANRIPFTNSGGDALTDSDSLVFDGTSLGVGTSTPRELLSIEGATNPSIELWDTTESGYTTLQQGNQNLTIENFHSSGGIVIRTGGSEMARFASTGNVGFGGETSPNNTVSVAGNVGIGSTFAGDENAPTNGLIVEGNTGLGTSTVSARLTVQTTGTTDILNLLETAGTEVFTVLENGNVGVGDTSPSALFTVGASDAFQVNSSGDVLTQSVGVDALESEDFGDFTCNGTTCSFDDDTIGTAEIADADFGAFTFSGGSATLDDDTVSSSTLNIANWTDGYVLQASTTAGGGFDWVATTTLGITSGSSVSFGSDNQIPYTNSGGDDFDYTSTFVFTGTNLGIGSSTPEARLAVDGSWTDTAIGKLTINSYDNDTEAIALQVIDENNNETFHIRAAGNGVSDTGIVYTAGVLGIGTTTPGTGAELAIDGSGTINQIIRSSDGTTGITLDRGDTGDVALLALATDGGTSDWLVGTFTGDSDFGIGDGAFNEFFTIVDNGLNGSFGFNDTTPDFRLETVGSTGSGYFGVTNSTDGDVFVIDSSGNVGIGSSSPGYSAEFVIEGSGAINQVIESTDDDATLRLVRAGTSDSAVISYYTGTTANWFLGGISGGSNFGLVDNSGSNVFFTVIDDGTTGSFGFNDATPDFQFETVGASDNGYFGITNSLSGDILTVDSSGDVGIGTTSPVATLDVWGGFLVGTSTTFFEVSESTGVSSFGDSSGTGDAIFQFADDTDAWVIGYRSSDKTFNIASSTDFDGTSRVSIAKNGNTTIAGSATTCVIGNGTSATSCSSSDERLKTDIVPLDSESVLAGLYALDPVSFYWNEWMQENGSASTTQFGLIAQEVEQIFPNLVRKDENTGYYTLDYQQLIPPIVLAIQELNLNLETIASTTASSTPASEDFAESFFDGVFTRITEWFADAGNGIADFVANRVRAKEICLSDGVSGETCITKSQLDTLLSGQSASAGGSESSNNNGENDASGSGDQSGSGSDTSDTGTSTDPVDTTSGDTSSTTDSGTGGEENGTENTDGTQEEPEDESGLENATDEETSGEAGSQENTPPDTTEGGSEPEPAPEPEPESEPAPEEPSGSE